MEVGYYKKVAMRRERFEIKYYFPLVRLDELIRFIKPFMVIDEYSNYQDRIGSYRISSLYFDSKQFDFYRTHVEGYQSRRKIRVRKYEYLKKSHYFLEIKNKVLFLSNKYRIKIDNSLLRRGIKVGDFNQLCRLILDEYSNNQIAEIVSFDMLTLKIKPVIIISCKRIAYNSKFEHDVRLTIDFDMQVSKVMNPLRFQHQYRAKNILPSYLGVVELKANRTIPRWLQDVILRFDLTRKSFSKYKEGVESIYQR
jgi:SPX domain protein involved in polyphosphate accumulation